MKSKIVSFRLNSDQTLRISTKLGHKVDLTLDAETNEIIVMNWSTGASTGDDLVIASDGNIEIFKGIKNHG